MGWKMIKIQPVTIWNRLKVCITNIQKYILLIYTIDETCNF